MSCRGYRTVWSSAISAGVAALAILQGALTGLAQNSAGILGGTTPPVVPLDPPTADEYNPSLLDKTVDQNNLIASVIKVDVENELKDARTRMATDPLGVQGTLKVALERVIKARAEQRVAGAVARPDRGGAA